MLSYNDITCIEGLLELCALQHLDLGHNLIKKVEGIHKGLTQLLHLDLSFNQVCHTHAYVDEKLRFGGGAGAAHVRGGGGTWPQTDQEIVTHPKGSLYADACHATICLSLQCGCCLLTAIPRASPLPYNDFHPHKSVTQI